MRLNFDQFGSDERGIQWTLEALFAVILLTAALLAVLESTSVGDSASEDQITQSGLSQQGSDVFSLASEEDLLRDAILYWDSGARVYINSTARTNSQDHYTRFTRSDSFPLATLLADTLQQQDLAYNLVLEYQTRTGGTDTRLLVYQGPPGGDSTTVSTNVVLADTDKPATTPNDCTLREIDDPTMCPGEDYYIPNANPANPERYNVVQVQLEVWRV